LLCYFIKYLAISERDSEETAAETDTPYYTMCIRIRIKVNKTSGRTFKPFVMGADGTLGIHASEVIDTLARKLTKQWDINNPETII
jgi:hypothetical protein